MDGGLLTPFPLEAAIEHGCTDILVLLTRAHAHHHPPYPWHARLLFDSLCGRTNRHIRGLMLGHHQLDAKLRTLTRSVGPGAKPIHLAAIAPPPNLHLDRLCMDPVRLWQSANAYGRFTMQCFEADPDDLNMPRPMVWDT